MNAHETAARLKPVLAITTVGTGFDAAALAESLVEQRLAACVNILRPVQSVYRWEGRLERDEEQLLLIKTVEERVDALREALFAQHPYEVPEFVVLAISGISEGYGRWLGEQTAPTR